MAVGDTVDPASELEVPIDLREADEDTLLFELAARTPISPVELATECVQDETAVGSVLQSRLGNRVRLDSTEFIRLTDAARSAVKRVSGPYIKSGTAAFKRGKSLHAEGEYGAAAEQFDRAVSVLESVSRRFNTVNYSSDTLERLVSTARKRHDAAAIEAAKDSVNFHLIEVRQHESEGDTECSSSPGKAIDAYDRAIKAARKAIETVDEYNASRLTDTSSRLSAIELRERVESLGEKRSELGIAEGTDPSSDGGPSSEKNSSSAVESSSDEDSDVERDESTREDSDEDVARFSEPSDHGEDEPNQTPDQSSTGSKEAAEARRNQPSELMRRLDEFYQPAGDKIDGWYRCQRTTSDGRTCDTKVYFTIRNEDDLREHEREHASRWEGTPLKAENDETTGGNEAVQSADDADRATDAGTAPKAAKLESDNDWSTIPSNQRLDGNIVVRVDRIQRPDNDPKSHILEMHDHNQQSIELDVWETHDLNVAWEEGHWYSFLEARGKVWETESGDVVKRLSSTRDLRVTDLGTDLEQSESPPSPDATPDTPGSGNPGDGADPSEETRVEIGTDPEEQSASGSSRREGTEGDTDGIFDDIISDFDNV